MSNSLIDLDPERLRREIMRRWRWDGVTHISANNCHLIYLDGEEFRVPEAYHGAPELWLADWEADPAFAA